MTLPNFLLIGAPKAGTTALHEYLKQHPEIYMSPVKEPNFFAFEGKQPDFCGPRDERAWTNQGSIVNRSDYEALFADAGDAIARGESSTLYLYVPETPQRIHYYTPDIKLIAILRHPVDRAFSNYLHLRRDGREWLEDFEAALLKSEERAKQYWSPAWHYYQVSLYSEQVQRYQQLFPSERFKIYLYEDWKDNPDHFLRDVCQFLGVDDRFRPDMSVKHNTSPHVFKNNMLVDLLLRDNPLKTLARTLLPASIRKPLSTQIFRRNMSQPPRLSPELRQKLIPYFQDDILRLQDLIGRDLSAWLG
ncbi:MAG: sulfotransferase [Spirulinaceae cyanobacterium RM2_2_10]|nr:sulfotransferase [Spirulinaceae cyanobacterium SM2_1_0]NJO21186.1 sulfotransferase [Spirulinaceae cyanobacterium RM2_2_10]